VANFSLLKGDVHCDHGS